MMQRKLVSDLCGCYAELLEGRTPEGLAGKYIRFEVLAAQELFEKHVSLAELRGSQERGAGRLKLASLHIPVVCSCGLMSVSLKEVAVHVANSSDRRRHGVKAWKRPR